jgi:hypothetical protein
MKGLVMSTISHSKAWQSAAKLLEKAVLVALRIGAILLYGKDPGSLEEDHDKDEEDQPAGEPK